MRIMYEIDNQTMKYLNESNWVYCYGMNNDHILEIFITESTPCELAKKHLKENLPGLKICRIGRILNATGESILNRSDVPKFIFFI